VTKPRTSSPPILRPGSQIGTLVVPQVQPLPALAYDYDRDACECPKPEKKPRTPRKVCYEGSYTERAFGLNKRKRKQVPCQ